MFVCRVSRAQSQLPTVPDAELKRLEAAATLQTQKLQELTAEHTAIEKGLRFSACEHTLIYLSILCS